MSSVQLTGIEKAYGSAVAVDRLSLHVQEGEFVSLLGPSGCGKTTTLRIVAGLVEPDGGDIVIDERPVRHVPAYERDIGFVFQQGALFPHRTVAENVAFGLKMRGMKRREREEKALETLRLVRLEGLERRRPAELSGGQQQRVALARALAIRPKVLLLDEPFSALDRRLRIELRREVRELQQELGITTIAVTHDQVEALSMSDRIVVMNEGRVEQVGPPDQVYRRPASRFVAEFMGESNILPGLVVAANGARVSVETEGGLRVDVPLESVSGVGDHVLTVLRPDRLIVRRAVGDSSEGAVKGHVYLHSFMGELTRYYIALPGNARIFVDVASPDGEPEFRLGDEVSVVALPEGVHCFSQGE